ncbi:MAG: hypothetical protein QNJ62_06505 [Methyloceanibacter sp.]|nr:hypothetical protein [Methyloceanibacter sp.]
MTFKERLRALQAQIQAYACLALGNAPDEAARVRAKIHEALDGALDAMVEENAQGAQANSLQETPESVVAVLGKRNGEKEVFGNA